MVYFCIWKGESQNFYASHQVLSNYMALITACLQGTQDQCRAADLSSQNTCNEWSFKERLSPSSTLKMYSVYLKWLIPTFLFYSVILKDGSYNNFFCQSLVLRKRSFTLLWDQTWTSMSKPIFSYLFSSRNKWKTKGM